MSTTTSETKACSRCKATKSRSEFNRDASRRDGLSSKCRSCSSAEFRQWHARQAEKECIIEGCEKSRSNRRYCSMHQHRMRLYGDPDTVLSVPGSSGVGSPAWKADEIGYAAAHLRVRAARGKASEHKCARCGEPAEQWAYAFTDLSTERYATFTRNGKEITVAYSPNPDHYTAFCVADHVAHDQVLGMHRRATNLAELHAAFVAGAKLLTDGRGIVLEGMGGL
jgi:hypothetical protein